MKRGSSVRRLAIAGFTASVLLFLPGCFEWLTGTSENTSEAQNVDCEFFCEKENWAVGWSSSSRDKCLFEEIMDRCGRNNGEFFVNNNCCCCS